VFPVQIIHQAHIYVFRRSSNIRCAARFPVYLVLTHMSHISATPPGATIERPQQSFRDGTEPSILVPFASLCFTSARLYLGHPQQQHRGFLSLCPLPDLLFL
jgi:hypothetical protein